MLGSQTAVFLPSLSFPNKHNGCCTTHGKPGFPSNFLGNMLHLTSITTPIPSLEPNVANTNYSAVPQPSQSTAATLFPIPESIVKKILGLEYVDMAELKPNAWLLHSEEPENLSTLFRKKEPVTDILVWVQCFSAMVAIKPRNIQLQSRT